MTPEPLLKAFEHPASLARQATARRHELFGTTVRVLPDPSRPSPAVAARVRRGTYTPIEQWPAPDALQENDRILVHVAPTAEDRAGFVGWLGEVSSVTVRWSIAPFSHEAGGVHRLWCIAAARLRLPGTVRVEIRHDLVGLRLAQLALGFGADTLAGPLEPDRKLPLAGLPRPTEATLAGLQTLVRQTGLDPLAAPADSPTPR
jgi:hypothetical protein